MIIETKFFGKISCEEREFIHFKNGLFGFEDKRNFVPLPFEDDSDAVICIQSIDSPETAFVVMNPFLLDELYQPTISEEDRRAIGYPTEENMSCYVICVVRESAAESTVNLKCPVIVNAITREARQVILEGTKYQFRHPLGDFHRKEET